jgi:GT2 family glycosyltransferase
MCKIQGWKIVYLPNTKVYKFKEISKLQKVQEHFWFLEFKYSS